MEITLIVKSLMGLLVLLALLVVFLAVAPKPVEKKVVKVEPKVKKPNTDLEYLRSVIRNRKSNEQELEEALDLILKHHGTIPKKLGMRPHPGFDAYIDILVYICRHPNATKEIIIKFDFGLEKKNPDYKMEINTALSKGLTSRGI